MTDIMQDVRDYFSDRFSSPLWLSIIVSWLLINWQLPLTAIFESDRFNVAYVRFYIESANHWCLATIPLVIGLSYSILSRSIKETLELISKTIRNLIAQIDRKGIFYKSISIADHEEQLSRLKRQLQRIESDKEQLHDVILENTKLTEQKTQLTNKINTLTLDLESAKSVQIRLQQKKDELENSLSNNAKTTKEIKEQNDILTTKNSSLTEQLGAEIATRRKHEEDNKNLESKINAINEAQEINQRTTSALKKHIQTNLATAPEEIKKLINTLEQYGASFTDQSSVHDAILIKQTYYDTIFDNCSNQLKNELGKPNSRSSILITLDVLSSMPEYNINELANKAGIPKNTFEKTMQLVINAEWLHKDSAGGIQLNSNGIRKLNELRNDKSLLNLTLILNEIDKQIEKNIISCLLESPLSNEDLKEKISFTPRLKTILSNLLNTGKVTKSGKIYFHR